MPNRTGAFQAPMIRAERSSAKCREPDEGLNEGTLQQGTQCLEAIRHDSLLSMMCRLERRVCPPLVSKRWGNHGGLWQREGLALRRSASAGRRALQLQLLVVGCGIHEVSVPYAAPR